MDSKGQNDADLRRRGYPTALTAQLAIAALTSVALVAGLIQPISAAVLFGALFAWCAGNAMWRNAGALDGQDEALAMAQEQTRLTETRRLEDMMRANEQLVALTRELEEARKQLHQHSQFKSDFLGHISHEIRTPLNAVVGMAELLSRTQMSPEQHELVSLISSSGETLLSVINDILNYSKIEAGEFTLDLSEFDLHDLTEGSAQLLAEQARLKELSLTTFVSPTLAQSYMGDFARLRQVLINLMGNSLRFASKGEVLISAVEDQDNKDCVRLSVKDNCAGMTNSVVASLFTPLTEVDIITARKYGGTGLGLSVSKKLVELMQGRMGVDNDEVKGTTFWFSVPLLAAPESPAELTEQPSPVRKKVMLVGKASSSIAVIMAYAKSWGVDCDYHPNGEQALTLLAEAPDDYQVIVVESASNDMSVVEFLGKVFEQEELSGIHAIVLTDSEQTDYEVKKLGVSLQILRKPFKKAQLRESLRQCQISLRRTGDIVRPESQLKSFIASVDFATRGTRSTRAEEKGEATTKLLVVEDNPVNRRLVHLQLRTLGFECDIVENGQEAVEALENGQYDLVFMDCWMPVLDGFAATAKIREVESSRNKHTPIVAMTANAMESDRDECLAAGMDDYISKPVTQTALKGIIEKWLTNRRALRFDP